MGAPPNHVSQYRVEPGRSEEQSDCAKARAEPRRLAQAFHRLHRARLQGLETDPGEVPGRPPRRRL